MGLGFPYAKPAGHSPVLPIPYAPEGLGSEGGGAGINDVLVGFVSAPGAVSDSDTILSAIEKLDGNITALTDSIQDTEYIQPSAGTSWTFTHTRGKRVNLAFFNAAGTRENPIDTQATIGQVVVTFATSEVHTAILPGNGTSASIRNDNIITMLASDINTALGVIDISLAKTFRIIMDTNITSAITFGSTPGGSTPLRLVFVKSAVAYTVVPLDPAKFKSSAQPIPVPLITTTPNTEDALDFLYSGISSKMAISSFQYGL